MFSSSNKSNINKSIVWEYFKKTENKTATCNLCRKVLKYFGSTTSLRQHLFRIHPIEMQYERRSGEPHMENLSTNASVVSSTNNCPTCTDNGPSTSSSEMQIIQNEIKFEFMEEPLKLGEDRTDELSQSKINEINIKLLKMIVLDFHPLSIIDNIGFLEYSAQLNPLYKPPDRKKLIEEILQPAYTGSVVNLKTVLDEVKYMSITLDMWTSEMNIDYITVTCHYIKDNKLFSRVLATKDLSLFKSSGSLTAESLGLAITAILNYWDIYHKIKAVVSDHRPNVKSAVDDFLQIYHLPCVAHTLNLSVSEALNGKPIYNILKKCRSLVGHLKYNILAAEKLRLTQIQMNNQVLEVKQDVATRWNSCFHMLERLLKIKDCLCKATPNLPGVPEILEANEWKIIEDCVRVLKPAENMSTVLSAEKYPTLSLVIPLFRGFQHSLKHILPETETGEWLKDTLLNVVTERLGGHESSKNSAIATFLDPRFKKFAFETEYNASNAQKWVSDELADLVSSKSSSVNTPKSTKEPPASINWDNTDIWAHFDSKISNVMTHSTRTSFEGLMVKRYLDIPLLDRKNDPLEWWGKCKNILPEMHDLATKYLSIPATSIPSERVFSKDGELTSMRRERVTSNIVDEIIFLNSHFQ